LASVDDLLEECWNDALLIRPHALFLTGDQIYADDVASATLAMAAAVGAAALGWGGSSSPEALPGDLDQYSFALAPGQRLNVLKPLGFTSAEGNSHLITFAEYVGMYLLVWSDEVWPREEDFPSRDNDVFTHHDDWWAKVDSPERDEAFENYEQTKAPLIAFYRGLKRVRRALANVPTYMSFDDHEVTDDWNIHRKWATDIYGSGLGARVVQNALAAYAVFQAWGNTPERFNSGTTVGGRLLAVLSRWRGANDADCSKIAEYVGLPEKHLVESESWDGRLTATRMPDSQSIVWDYEIAAGNYRILSLDTRTQRQFPPKTGENAEYRAAMLIGDGARNRQITSKIETPPRTYEVTFVVSSVPVIGHLFLDGWLKEGVATLWYRHSTIANWADCAVHQPIPSKLDYEAWEFHRPCFEALLKDLCRFQRVVVLSGDVHYSFSANMEYWDEHSDDPIAARIVQLTSSSLLHMDSIPSAAGPVAEGAQHARARFRGTAVLGWDDPKTVIGFTGPPMRNVNSNGKTPGLMVYPYDEAAPVSGFRYRSVLEALPFWRYRIRFAKDDGTVSQRTQGRVSLSGLGTPSAQHQTLARLNKYLWVLAKHNLGDMTFDDADHVRHSLWFTPADVAPDGTVDPVSAAAFPISTYTEHVLNFAVPSLNAADKPEIGRPEVF
jgi:hypothetical protein